MTTPAYTVCEHIAVNGTQQTFATFTYLDIHSAFCPRCLAELTLSLSSVLTSEEIGQAVAFHSGQSATWQPDEDCITITSDILRNDAAGDRARAALKWKDDKAQRKRTLKSPAQSVRVVRPARRIVTA